MFRSSYSLKLSFPIPRTFSQSSIISALHNHSNILSLQALTTDHKEIPLNPSTADEVVREDAYFTDNVATVAPSLKLYQATEAIPVIPGIGEWGKKYITFPVWFQDTSLGVRTRADAPVGVVVRAEWTVQDQVHQEAPASTKSIPDESEWALVENVTVDCHWLLMPFVRRQMENAHRVLCEEFVKMLGKESE